VRLCLAGGACGIGLRLRSRLRLRPATGSVVAALEDDRKIVSFRTGLGRLQTLPFVRTIVEGFVGRVVIIAPPRRRRTIANGARSSRRMVGCRSVWFRFGGRAVLLVRTRVLVCAAAAAACCCCCWCARARARAPLRCPSKGQQDEFRGSFCLYQFQLKEGIGGHFDEPIQVAIPGIVQRGRGQRHKEHPATTTAFALASRRSSIASSTVVVVVDVLRRSRFQKPGIRGQGQHIPPFSWIALKIEDERHDDRIKGWWRWWRWRWRLFRFGVVLGRSIVVVAVVFVAAAGSGGIRGSVMIVIRNVAVRIVEKVYLQHGFVLPTVQIDGHRIEPIVVSLAVVLVVDGTHVQDAEASCVLVAVVVVGCLCLSVAVSVALQFQFKFLLEQGHHPIGADELGRPGTVDARLLVAVQASHRGLLPLQEPDGVPLCLRRGKRALVGRFGLFESLVEGVVFRNHREGFGRAGKERIVVVAVVLLAVVVAVAAVVSRSLSLATTTRSAVLGEGGSRRSLDQGNRRPAVLLLLLLLGAGGVAATSACRGRCSFGGTRTVSAGTSAANANAAGWLRHLVKCDDRVRVRTVWYQYEILYEVVLVRSLPGELSDDYWYWYSYLYWYQV